MLDKTTQLNYLRQFLTEERKALFTKHLENRTNHFVFAVEDIQKEQNASALLRTCECLGVQDIYIIENEHEYKVSRGIVKGSDKWINAHIFDQEENNSLECINALREKGYKIVATSPSDHVQSIEEYDISQKTAFFLGGEQEGLTQTVFDEADEFIRIPMVGFTESFNLSVAGGILLYEMLKRLRASDIPWQFTSEEKLELELQWAKNTIHIHDKLLKRHERDLSDK